MTEARLGAGIFQAPRDHRATCRMMGAADKWNARYREQRIDIAQQPARVLRAMEQLAPALLDTLRPGGLLFYQTFIRDRIDTSGPANPAYRLEANELLLRFAPLRILFYRQNALVGDLARGFRNQAMLVAQKNSHRRRGLKLDSDNGAIKLQYNCDAPRGRSLKRL